MNEAGNSLNLLDAIHARHSVRAYKETALNEEVVAALSAKIDACNEAGCLHIQLVTDEPKAFMGTLARYGKFSGVRNYLVMAGPKADDMDERIGYYGEQIVLLAHTLGLNTCWAGLTYSKVPGTYILGKDERIACYIALGYGKMQGVSHKIKKPEQVSNVNDLTPEWFRNGVEAALLAPTAVNQQKFRFVYAEAHDGRKDMVAACRTFSLVGYTRIDLGIAKYHFEIGAGKENFEWK